jgi:tetratricopeptide (TPR) repeat protein
MDAGTVQNEAMRKVIEELSPGLEKNAGFWTRLGEFHMVRRRYDDSAACFAKAWEIGPKDDAEIKRVGHGLVASHERQYKYSQAIEAEKAVLDRLAVKDDYLRLAEIHRRAKNIEAMKAAIANQLEAAPTLQGKVEAARVYVDAKLPEDGMAVLNGVPRTIGADQNPTVRAAVLAATVLRIRSAKDQGTAPDAELVGILRSNRAEFLDLARDLVWLQPYYRQGEGYLRTPRQQVDQPPRQEQKP